MSAPAPDQVTADQVQSAAALVALPLTPTEAAEVAHLLSEWIPGAIALSTRMQSAELDSLTPIITFSMPGEVTSDTHSIEGTRP